MPSDESKGSQLDAIGSLAQRQLDNTVFNVAFSLELVVLRLQIFRRISLLLQYAANRCPCCCRDLSRFPWK